MTAPKPINLNTKNCTIIVSARPKRKMFWLLNFLNIHSHTCKINAIFTPISKWISSENKSYRQQFRVTKLVGKYLIILVNLGVTFRQHLYYADLEKCGEITAKLPLEPIFTAENVYTEFSVSIHIQVRKNEITHKNHAYFLCVF